MGCTKKKEKAGGCCPKGKSVARNGGAVSACKRKAPAKKATKKDRQGVPVPAVSYARQFQLPVIYQQLRNQQVANFQKDTRDATTMIRLDYELTPASPVLPLRDLPTPMKQAYEEMGTPRISSLPTSRITGTPTTGAGSRTGGRRKLETEFFTAD